MKKDKEVKVKFVYHGPMGRMKEGYEHYEKTGKGLCLVEDCKENCKEKYELEQ